MSPNALEAAAQRNQRGRWPAAIGLLFCALTCLICLDASGKWLVSQDVPVAFVTWARYTGHFFLVILVFAPRLGLRRLFYTSSPKLQATRGLLMLCVSLLYFAALKFMPLAQATALFYLTPVLAVFMAWAFLHEAVPLRAWFSLLFGFAGVLLVVRPGMTQDQPLPLLGVMLVLLAAVGNAAYQTLTRARNFSDSAPTQVLYAAAAGCVLLTVSMPFWFQGFTSSPVITLVLVGTGVLGMIGHWLLTLTFAMAPAAVLSPWMFAQLLLSIALGWLVFGQAPDQIALIGMVFVALTPWLARRG